MIKCFKIAAKHVLGIGILTAPNGLEWLVLGLLNGKVGLLAGKTTVVEGFRICVNGRQYWAMITNFVGGS